MRRRPHRGADRIDRSVQVIGFAGQQQQVSRRLDLLAQHGLGRHGEVAKRALDDQSAIAKLRTAPFTDEKLHVGAGLHQTRTEIAADGAGTEDKDFHGF